MSTAPDLFAPLAAEDWLVSRAAELGHPLDPAAASTPLKDRLRTLITAEGLSPVIAGRRPDGKGAEDFEAAYARVFGEALIPKAPRRPRSSSAHQPNRGNHT